MNEMTHIGTSLAFLEDMLERNIGNIYRGRGGPDDYLWDELPVAEPDFQHPSGVECVEIVEHMTHNLGRCCELLWKGREYRKALWHLERSYSHDASFLLTGLAADHFRLYMKHQDRAKRVLALPSPWTEPVRRSIGYLIDLHCGQSVNLRAELYAQAFRCVHTAIRDAEL